LLFCLGRKRLGQTQNALISLINLDQATKLHPPFRHQKRRREKPPLNQKRRREKAPLTSPTTTSNNTEPIVATMIAETMPEPIRMPSCGINQLPIRAPTMPMAMSPIMPNPPPATILPASQPATSPTKRMTRRLCPEITIAPPHALLGNSLASDNPEGTKLFQSSAQTTADFRFGSEASMWAIIAKPDWPRVLRPRSRASGYLNFWLGLAICRQVSSST